MSEAVIRSGCCKSPVRYEALEEVPPPPGALLATTSDPPDEWKGGRWICEGCGNQVGVTYDYGTVDLGLVRDEQLGEQANDFWVYEGEPPA